MKTVIAIPCMDMVHTQFMKSVVGMRLSGEVRYFFGQSSLVYDSRNQLSRQALEWGADNILWLDSDMIFEPDMFEKMIKHMESGIEFVTGLYVTRKSPIKPVVYESIGETWDSQLAVVPYAEPVKNIPDELFEIDGCGFGGVMVSARVVSHIYQLFGLPFSPQDGFGEDLSFCRRVKEIGVPMYCDPSIKMGHVGQHVYTLDDIERG